MQLDDCDHGYAERPLAVDFGYDREEVISALETRKFGGLDLCSPRERRLIRQYDEGQFLLGFILPANLR